MTTNRKTGIPPRRYPMLVLIALTAIGVDLLTKEWVLATFHEGERLDVIGSVVQFTLVYNTGAAFSMGTDHTWVFSTIATVVVIAIACYGLRVRSAWWAVALGLMMGGAAGNLLDRIFREPEPFHGAVVDFVKVMSFPVFNVADSCVVVGAILVVALTFKGLDPDGTWASDKTEAAVATTDDTEGDTAPGDDTTEGKGQ
ncbi:signal peptidase II [Nocardiopsis lambiniae]|uniref:Lipoprotein signal peptidase n=1 Tax=Nocardiopsis lambiniae TaxID=3075539 RepID=A0ABU2MEX4_9ACTN|nr:signal peptidase II [Nocardiopsis sp. DSM 44743]MDT0330441.1 signal peptidase II [Nocardiopsis sp. DSM 44743]